MPSVGRRVQVVSVMDWLEWIPIASPLFWILFIGNALFIGVVYLWDKLK